MGSTHQERDSHQRVNQGMARVLFLRSFDLDKHAEHFATLRTNKVDMDGMATP